MTERQPDDLYDALRDRLAGYGQEPPAPLWAAIRAQLPPPVAQPRLRRRRWAPAALLVLLLAVASGTGWRWWRNAATVGRSSTSSHQNAAHAKGPAATNGVAATRPLTAPPTVATARRPKLGTGRAINGKLGVNTYESSRYVTKNNFATAATPNVTGAAAAPSASRRQEPVRGRAGEFAIGLYARNAMPAAKSGAEAKSSRPIPGSDSTGSTKTSLLAAAPQSTNATSQHAPTRKNIATLPSIAAPDKYKSLLNRLLSSESKDAPATEMANAAVPAGVMAARAVSLLTPASPLPAVRLSADTLSAIPAAAARRWVAEVLAGPARTYRQLGSAVNSGVLASAPAPFSNSVGYAYDNTAANQLAREEKPSAGFGVQAQLRRALTGRWSLSAGLGYQEYASQTSYPTSATVRLQPSPASYTQRDTYRFLTAPVRLGYALGAARGRLRFGLLAGADAAFYLGGASNGTGTAPRSWSSSGSPYRPLSLSVCAGLDLRYRVASRLEVLAQPTGTYFLTALAKAESDLTPRYLFGTGALFGLSYGLR